MSYSADDPVGFRYLDKFITCTQPIGETSVGPGTLYPFAMTLEDAMNLYWKIYSFKSSGDFAFNWEFMQPTNPPKLEKVTMSGNLGGSFSPEFGELWPKKMSEMVCIVPPDSFNTPTFYGYGAVGSFFTSGTGGGKSSGALAGELGIVNFSPILRTEGKDDFQAKYYIPFSFGADSGDYGGRVSTSPIGIGAKTTTQGIFKLKIGDTTYDTSLFAFPTIASAFNLSLTGSIVVEAKDAKIAG